MDQPRRAAIAVVALPKTLSDPESVTNYASNHS